MSDSIVNNLLDCFAKLREQGVEPKRICVTEKIFDDLVAEMGGRDWPPNIAASFDGVTLEVVANGS